MEMDLISPGQIYGQNFCHGGVSFSVFQTQLMSCCFNGQQWSMASLRESHGNYSHIVLLGVSD